MRRRSFVDSLLRGGTACAVLPLIPLGHAVASRAAPLPDVFPRQDPAIAKEVVGAAHTDLNHVRELVTARPSLAKATWDWGFGDWETALGAASHTGQVEIARFLLANGARPTLFSAAMLGQLAVVKAFVESSPDVPRIRGPHDITLLAHARAGGDGAREVLAYLQGVEGADVALPSTALDAALRGTYVGTYAFGEAPTERLEVTTTASGIRIARTGDSARGLTFLGDHTFRPPGASSVRIHFTVADARATQLSILDGGIQMEARRIA